MAIPEDLNRIGTNLPSARLKSFLDALVEKRCTHVPGSSSMFAESAACHFEFEGSVYFLSEFVEMVEAVYLKTANPAFVQTLIDEHEAALAIVVEAREYRKAEAINEKIKNLQKLLRQ